MAMGIKIAFTWTNYCRLCLQEGGPKIPIFGKEGIAENIPLKIKECLRISTYDGDPLPRMICQHCLSKLNTAYELHTKAMESFKQVMMELQPVKNLQQVEEYIRDCELCLEFDKPNNGHLTDGNITRSAVGRRSGSSSGSADDAGHLDQLVDEQEQVRGRVTRSRVGGRASLTVDGGPTAAAAQPKGTIEIVPDIDNPTLTSKASTSKDSVFLVPLPPKPKPHDNHFHDPMDYDSNEDLSKRKRKRITEHYDEALMDTGGNLVLACGAGLRTREWRHRDGKRKKVGPASRTRAQATCLPFSSSSSWQCVLCSCFFASHSMLRRHLSICLICQTCGLEFSSAKDKAVHEEDHIYVNCSPNAELLYKCFRCDRAFAAHLMLKIHIKYDHPETSSHLFAEPKQYVDPAGPDGDADGDNCKCESDEERPVKVERVHDDRTIEGHEICPKCTRPFVTKQRLNYHLLDHEQLIKCLYCPWRFPAGPGRRRHQRRMHGDKAEPMCFTCSVCKETFETKSILFLHKKNSHKLDPSEDIRADGPVKKSELEHCHVCDKMIQPSKFEAHLLHHAEDAYGGGGKESVPNPESLYCPICNVTSATPELHRAHIAQKHIQQKTSSFRCDGCSQGFANVEAINRHSCPGKGKEKEKQWKNCKHCGQNLSRGIVHVCDNECPICHKIFKSARGQRLHIQHKHENTESYSASGDDKSETRSSGGESAGAFESVIVKAEKADADADENAQQESPKAPEEDPVTPDPAEPEATPPETAEDPLDAAPAAEAEEESPTTTSNPVSDEPSSSTSPTPTSDPTAESAPTPTHQEHAVSAPDAEKPTQAKGTPKIRLRPNSSLLADVPPNALAATPKMEVVQPPPPYRPPLFESPAPILAQPSNPENPKTVIRTYSGPSKSAYSNVTNTENERPAYSVANNVVPNVQNSISEARVEHSFSSAAPTAAPVSATLSTIPPPLSHISAPIPLTGAASGITITIGNPVPVPASMPAVMPVSTFRPMGPPAYNPVPNSSQIASNNLVPNPVALSNVLMNPRPFSPMLAARPTPQLQHPPVNPFNHNQSHPIKCVQISTLQSPPVSSVGTLQQMPPNMVTNQSSMDHSFGKMYNPAPVESLPVSRPTDFHTFQPSSGATVRDDNRLRDVLLGRRTDQDFL